MYSVHSGFSVLALEKKLFLYEIVTECKYGRVSGSKPAFYLFSQSENEYCILIFLIYWLLIIVVAIRVYSKSVNIISVACFYKTSVIL